MKMVNIYGMIDPRERDEYRYVGKTPYSIEQRLVEHIEEAERKREKKVNTHKCNWLRKLFRSNILPVMVLIDKVPMKDWVFWEKYYIKHYKNLGHRLTNATNGGEGVMGYKHTKESNEKNRKAKLGKVSPQKGKTWEEIHGVEKATELRKGMKDKHPTQTTKDKISKTLTGKMAGKNHPLYGKVSSRKGKTWEELFGVEKAKEMKKVLREARLGIMPTEESNEKNRQSHLGKVSPMKGKTFEEMHGIEKATKLKKALLGNTFGKRKLNKVV